MHPGGFFRPPACYAGARGRRSAIFVMGVMAIYRGIAMLARAAHCRSP